MAVDDDSWEIVFEPDLELDLAVGVDRDVVFTAEAEQVTGHSAAAWLAIFAGFAVIADRMKALMFGGACLFCGAKSGGEHSKDCLWRKRR